MLRTTLPNGKSVKRGDAILVEDGSLIATAIVDKIDQSEGYPFVSAAIIDTTRNSMDTGQNNPPIKGLAAAVGARHVSTPSNITGIRFCLIDEEEEALLRAHHNKIAQNEPGLVEESDALPDPSPQGVTAPVSSTATTPVFKVEGDTDGDGKLSNREKKNLKKEK